MTYLFAYDATNLSSINFNYWYGLFFTGQQEFNDNVPDGDAYEDSYFLWASSNDILALYGYDFGGSGNYNGNTFLNKGTIEAIGQWAWDGANTNIETWHWSGFELDMREFFRAAKTKSFADDEAIVERLLGGDDEMWLSNFADDMRGFRGDDEMRGLMGNDTLRGDEGQDMLIGDEGNDRLIGGNGHDFLDGGDGNDLLRGGNGMDDLLGRDGNDRLYGGRKRDDIRGGDGDDELRGGEGSDLLKGGADEDILYGNGGRDYLNGGSGNDRMFGGFWTDIFEFNDGDDRDVAMDFTVFGQHRDKVDLSGVASIVSFNDLINNHVTQVAGGTRVKIETDGGDILILRDDVPILVSDLSAANFLFS